MREYGYDYDPNRLPSETSSWWETLGSTLGPAPYETAAWAYYQSFNVTTTTVRTGPPDVDYDGGPGIPDGDGTEADLATNGLVTPPEFQDIVVDNVGAAGDTLMTNGQSGFTQPTPQVILDGGIIGQTPTVESIVDDGVFNSQGEFFKTARLTFASVYVYDSKASEPHKSGVSNVNVFQKNLLTDMPTLELFTNGEPNSLEIAADTGATGVPANYTYDSPPGTELGRLDFELLENTVTLTDWMHYGWNDSTPVVKAFQAMVNGLPQCAEKIVVRDDPTAFWVAQGFVHEYKGSPQLVYDPANAYKTY